MRAGSILVVEDDSLLRYCLAEALRDRQLSVVEACNAAGAVRLLTSSQDVGLLCTDLRMPGSMDGVGLIKWSRRHRPELPIIVMSGEAALLEVAAADAVFSKPFSYGALADAAIGLLARKARPAESLRRA